MAKFFVAQQCNPVKHTPKLWHSMQQATTLMAQRCTPRSNRAAIPEKLARALKQLSWQKFLV
jgi:hypothetical protein